MKNEIRCTFGALARAYGVPLDPADAGDPILLWRGDDGRWHTRALPNGPDLDDAAWAPRSDAEAEDVAAE